MKRITSMKLAKWVVGPALIFLISGGSFLRATSVPDKTLPDFVVRELTHVAETYRVLDVTAAKVWPGWTNFREFPIMLKYPNNLQVLIGHPNPPAPFEKVPGLNVEDKEIYADFSAVSTAKSEYPLVAGGGPLPFGKDKDGKPMTTVMMNFQSTDILKKGGYGVIPMPFCVELQVLIYIHELFHCFQNGHIQRQPVGNLQFNPDAPYALYSTIEGEALLKAYKAKTREEAVGFIKDFLAARMLKRNASMPEQQRKEESADDLSEGTAVYSEVRSCEILRDEGYKTKLDLSKDPYYTGFKNVNELLTAHVKQLKNAAEEIYDCKGKCYDYGCFQALLLQRYFPGWQDTFAKTASALDAELAKRIAVDEKEIPAYEKRFRELYAFDKIKARCDEAIGKRDAAYHEIKERSGISYILNFKPIDGYESQLAQDVVPYTLGLIHMYMNGLPAVKHDQTEISPISVPVEGNELYYWKIVDTAPKSGIKPYSVQGTSKDGLTYENAVITTPLFTLKTPLVRIEESNQRVKFIILPVLQQ